MLERIDDELDRVVVRVNANCLWNQRGSTASTAPRNCRRLSQAASAQPPGISASLLVGLSGRAHLTLSKLHGLALAGLCVGLAAFIGVTVIALLVWWPRSGWHFAVSPMLIIKHCIDPPVSTDLDTLRRDLALYADAHYGANQRQINTMLVWFQVACALLLLEVASLVVFVLEV